ncbi:transposase domain-containing protein [Methylobacterium sp. UNC378MF]|uniref:transposase domain-containing protein n=1 Tax=Methylobacterium sp. UNC378MF TaxID=1502748 RepID=UPI0015875294|nr:transposase domain-containing protein [Methylobacterium sp. UNC378MF]
MLVGVEPQTYLAEVITRNVEGHLHHRLDCLLPITYQATPVLKTAAYGQHLLFMSSRIKLINPSTRRSRQVMTPPVA